VNWKVSFSGRQHAYTLDEMMVVLKAMMGADPLTQGRYRDEFEAAFADYLGVGGGCFAVSNATAALEMAAQLCQFEEGDEVVIPAHTFTSTAYPFVKHGAKVVWADIDPETHVVTGETLYRHVSVRTRAIVVVHLYGYLVDIDDVETKSPGYAVLIEDAAQVIGCKLVGGEGVFHWNASAGTMGEFGVFSTHSHKNMSTLGEGGMLWVRKQESRDIIPMLRHNGHRAYPKREDYWVPAMGDVDMPELNGKPLMPHNFCLGEVECALGTKLLERIDDINDEKRRRALWFIDSLRGHGRLEFHRVDSKRHNYHLLVAYFRGTTEERDGFMRRMAYDHGIQCVVQYMPLYRYPFYQKLGLGEADCPVTDDWYSHMVSFPFHHSLTEGQLEHEVECVKEVLDGSCV
jgi:perosamine synthetase